ncbi:methionine--tRNA ligase [Patescibacteria group bacterium AH-259-L05]|nr:methionine--tRNA ligase [Patescibacteria group bacterium AH-259-L05]
MSKFYITTPIYYVNDKPHIGGAYTTIAADVLSRWHRMRGDDTFFLTGVDEHGQKIAQAAREQNMTPQQLCDQNAAKFQQVFDTLKISYDRFIRTTEKPHEKMVSHVLNTIQNKNLIYSGTYSGLYCVGCERYYTSKELTDGKCPLHHKKPITLSENCYFFKLSAFQKPLLRLIDTNEWVIEPEERKNEVMGFLKSETLEDLAISREKVEWGIPIPWERSQSIYVWIDALFNYLSGIDWDGKNKKMPDYWPPDVQLIGKDILRFHAIIWPAFLLSLDIPLPKLLYAHGFFTVGGQKMSKSLGNVLDPEELATTFGPDALRWLLLSEFPFGQDGDISLSKFYDKYNADLSHGVGNLVRRTIALALKYKGAIEPPKAIDVDFKQMIEKAWKIYEGALDDLKFETAIGAINDIVTFCDKYIDSSEPWRLSSDDKQYQTIVYNLLEVLRHLSWLIYPFMPKKSNVLFQLLGLKTETKKSLSLGKQWGKVEFNNISQGDILFPQL